MALEMRESCERCAASLPHGAEAFICSYECTFCRRLLGGARERLPELRRRARAAAAANGCLSL